MDKASYGCAGCLTVILIIVLRLVVLFLFIGFLVWALRYWGVL